MFKKASLQRMYAKICFWGRQGTGKTTQVVRTCAALHEQKGGKGDVFMIDTENASQSVRELLKVRGIDLQVLQTTKPAEAIKGLQMAADMMAQGDCSVLLIDSVTDLYKLPRVDWMVRNKKDKIPLNAYSGIDKPYQVFCEKLKWAKCDVVYTLKEKDDKETVDETDQTHKKPDGKDSAEYIARVKVHCQALKRKNADMAVRCDVSDDVAPGKVHRVVDPEPELWAKMVERFK